LKVQRLGGLEDISWRDFGAMVQNTMLGLHALAINKGDNIAIVGRQQFAPAMRRPGDIGWRLPNVVIAPTVSDRTMLKFSYSRCHTIFIDRSSRFSPAAVKNQKRLR
jgi:long-subunit acyl-CoA synthetase (AMP-forming)